MIQLDKSISTNTFAFYPDSSTTVESLLVEYSQDYNKFSGSFEATIQSKKNWIVGLVSGSELPSPTGQYTLTIKELTLGSAYIWGTTNVAFGAANFTWGDASAELVGDTLAVERAYVQGDNNPTITTYSSPNETGRYTTYTA